MKKMSSTQYQKFLDKLELSQVRAAKMFGLDPRTSRRYAGGEIEKIHDAVNIVLRMMVKHRYTADDVDKLKKEQLL